MSIGIVKGGKNDGGATLDMAWFTKSAEDAGYEVYDDFSGTLANWSTSVTGSGVVSISGGTMKIDASASNNTTTAEAVSIDMVTNKDVWFDMKVYANKAGSNNAGFKIEFWVGSTLYTIDTFGWPGGTSDGSGLRYTYYTTILLKSLGSDQYDVYLGNYKIMSSITEADPELKFKCSAYEDNAGASAILNIDNIRYANTVE